jgi:hypothetical protein
MAISSFVNKVFEDSGSSQRNAKPELALLRGVVDAVSLTDLASNLEGAFNMPK